MKTLALIAGIILLAFGLLFAGQGSGIIMWPASSFMLAARGVGRLRPGHRGGWGSVALVVAAALRRRARLSYTGLIGHNRRVL